MWFVNKKDFEEREKGKAFAQLLMGGELFYILSSVVGLIERFFLKLMTVIEAVCVCVCLGGVLQWRKSKKL